jgi:hypothetical protein
MRVVSALDLCPGVCNQGAYNRSSCGESIIDLCALLPPSISEGEPSKLLLGGSERRRQFRLRPRPDGCTKSRRHGTASRGDRTECEVTFDRALVKSVFTAKCPCSDTFATFPAVGNCNC